MTMIRSVALATILTALAAAPALADWQSVGQVHFDRNMSHDTAGGLGQPVRALSLTARGNDVFCDGVRATFASGREADIFSGRLERDQNTRVDLPGDAHVIQRLDFRCRAEHRRAGVEIAADTADRRDGHWGDDHSGDDHRDGLPHGDGRWGDNGGPNREPGGGVLQPDNWGRWQKLATESFERGDNRESSDAGWAGRRVEALALRPTDNDARCRRVVTVFADGERRELNIGRYDVLRRGYFYVLDLPGDARNVERVGMACRAMGDRDVQIEVWSKARH